MSKLVFRIYVENEFQKEFQGREIQDYLIGWDGKLRQGIVLNTNEGQVKVVDVAILNPQKNEGQQVTELYLKRM